MPSTVRSLELSWFHCLHLRSFDRLSLLWLQSGPPKSPGYPPYLSLFKHFHLDNLKSSDIMAPDTVYSMKPAHEDESHQAISSYFIGPKAENISYFKDNISIILDEMVATRHRYFPQDGVYCPYSFDNCIH